MKRFYIYLFAAFCTAFWGACTGNFRELNDDLSGISDGDLEADDNGFGYRLQIVQQGIYFNYDFGKGKNWPFQMTQNLNADMFSGYMHDPKPLQGGSHNSDYNLQDGWNSAMWQFTYSYVMPQIYQLEQTAREKMPPFYAIAKILKVLAMHRVTDYYGPVIYSHFADRGSEYVPDSQQQVYGCFFDDLDEAADILAAWGGGQPEAGEFSRFDLLLDGSYAAWLRFANSLRMRLAVRIAVAAPEKARAEFRKAAQAAGGVIETNMENAAVKTSGTYSNPLGEINLNWNEAALNASMESVLTGYGDPRLPKFFKPCGSDVVIAGDAGEGTVALKGQYHGIRQGTGFSHNYYAAFSRLTVDTDTDAVLMTAAEVCRSGIARLDGRRCGALLPQRRCGIVRAMAAVRGRTLSGERRHGGRLPRSGRPGERHRRPVPRVAPLGCDGGRRTEARADHHPEMDCHVSRRVRGLGRTAADGISAPVPRASEPQQGLYRYRNDDPPAAVPGRAGDVRSRAVCGARCGTRRRRPRWDAPVVGRGAQFLIRKPRTVLPGRCVVRRLSEFPACAQQDIARADGIAVGARAYSVEGRIGIFFAAEKVCGGRRSFPFPVYFPAQRCVGQ